MTAWSDRFYQEIIALWVQCFDVVDEEHAARSDSLDKLTELTALDTECSIDLNHSRWCEITEDGMCKECRTASGRTMNENVIKSSVVPETSRDNCIEESRNARRTDEVAQRVRVKCRLATFRISRRSTLGRGRGFPRRLIRVC
jgi:hypothetical protein